MGAVGIARVFVTGGTLNRPLYSPDDPFWTGDHFFQKLLKLESLMNTKSGKAEARRTEILKGCLRELKLEIS